MWIQLKMLLSDFLFNSLVERLSQRAPIFSRRALQPVTIKAVEQRYEFSITENRCRPENSLNHPTALCGTVRSPSHDNPT